MHELGIITGVVQSAEVEAAKNGASKVIAVVLAVGEMTEAFEDSLRFSYEILCPGTMLEGSTLEIVNVPPKSICLDCNNEFVHERYERMCSKCSSTHTKLIEGRDIFIKSIEVEDSDE